MPTMAPWTRRALTTGEIALGRGVFADAIDWPRAGLLYAPPLPHGAMVPLGLTIVHGLRWPPPQDFAADTVDRQGWFIHELAHVWQAARGVVLAAAKLRALGRGAYRVHYQAGKPFDAYNIEQQAEIARMVFLARIGRPLPQSPPRAALEALWPVRCSA